MKQKESSEKTQKLPNVQLSLAAVLMLNEGVNWEMHLGKRPGIRSARGSQRGAEVMLWVVGSIVS